MRLLLRTADALVQVKTDRHAAAAAGGEVKPLAEGDARIGERLAMLNQVLLREQRVVAKLFERLEFRWIQTARGKSVAIERRLRCGEQRLTDGGNLVALNLPQIPFLGHAGFILKSLKRRTITHTRRQGPISTARQGLHRLRRRFVNAKQRVEGVFE